MPKFRNSVGGFRHRRRLRGDLGIVNKCVKVAMMHLNANGLGQISVQDVNNACTRDNLMVAAITETHFRSEQSLDHHIIPGYKTFESRRSDVAGDKPGGGVLIYCKESEGIVFRQHTPDISSPDCAFVDRERCWVIFETPGFKTAVCAVYMGCQYSDNRHTLWNTRIYSVIMQEQADLRKKGFRICHMGDFNGHVGCDPRVGIRGNKYNVNENGQMIRDFVLQSELVLVNGMCRARGSCFSHVCDSVCSGLWTRQMGNISTIVDYILVSAEHAESIVSMKVDDSGDYGGDSDHNMIFIILADNFVTKTMFSSVVVKKTDWNIKEDQDWSLYSQCVHKNLGHVDKSSVVSMAGSLSSILYKSLEMSVGLKCSGGHKKPPSLPREIVAEIKTRRLLSKEWKVLLGQHERDKRSIPDSDPSQTLVQAARLLDLQRVRVKTLLTAHNKSLRKINIDKCTGGGRQAVSNFWSFVTNREKKSTDIKCLLNERSGVLKCSPDEIADEAAGFLKTLFEGSYNCDDKPPRGPTGSGNEHLYSKSSHPVPPPPPPGGHPSHSHHDYQAPAPPRLVSSDDSKSACTDPDGFLDSDYSIDELRVALSSLKCCKARGWDNLPNECLKFAPVEFHLLLLDLYNSINELKPEDPLPPGWCRGRIVLVHKRGPIELLSNYRPLTVIISLSSLYSRLLNGRLTVVTEEHDLLGEIQAGFRQGRCCADNNFVLNTILSKANALGNEVHTAYIDLTKAYDTVNREKLWVKMLNLGFSTKFVACIQRMYNNDSIVTEVCGIKTRPIFLSRGVRQGCSMSPILFALYMSDLGWALTRSDHGFLVSGLKICSLFYADDIVLVDSSISRLKELIYLVKKHCDALNMSISISKSNVVSPSQDDVTVVDQYGEENLTLERVSMYKYLGLEMYKTMHKTCSEKQKKSILTAKRYKGACVNISHRGPDVSVLASCLWTNVAIPAILFGCESVPFSDTTISNINRIQSQLAKVMLGLPVSVHNFVAQTELGFEHFGHRLWETQLKFCHRWLGLPDTRWPKLAIMEHMSGVWKSPYWEYINKIKTEISLPYLYSHPMTKLHLDRYFMQKVNTDIVDAGLPAVRVIKSLSRADYVCEDESCTMIAGVKFNYCSKIQCQGPDRKRRCPFCPAVRGVLTPLASEFHVSWVCPAVSGARRESGISDFIMLCRLRDPNGSECDSHYKFLNGLDADGAVINQSLYLSRAFALQHVRDVWLNLI
jgi:exonuclease III